MNLQGQAAAPGIAIAKVFKLEKHQVKIDRKKISDSAAEKTKFNKAVIETIKDIDNLIKSSEKKIGSANSEVFKAHKQIASDPAIKEEISTLIDAQKVNAAYAIEKISCKYQEMFCAMDDDYMKERAADVKDVLGQIQNKILGIKTLDLSRIKENAVIVCEDLVPSQTASLNHFAQGFVTEVGGVTSHSAIMANSLQIPAVVGLSGILKKVKHHQPIIIDGSTGRVILSPSKKDIAQYQKMQQDLIAENKMLSTLVDKKPVTLDDHQVKIEANIGGVEDLEVALTKGIEGVGLFRTEFLYMNSPT